MTLFVDGAFAKNQPCAVMLITNYILFNPGNPPAGFAILTARRIASAITCAANAPTIETSAFLAPVERANITSPSNMVCAGLIVRATPFCAICATLVACAFVNFAFVATTPMTVLAREAGLPFQPPLGSTPEAGPFGEWLSLMEVVQMLCPTWPVRDSPMQGEHWRI